MTKTCPHCTAPHNGRGHCCSRACGSAWVEARRDAARGFTDADVLRLIDGRLTSGAICDALGTHAKNVRHVAQRNGRVVFDPASQWTDAMWTKAKEMLASGATVAAIGDRLGVSYSSVKNKIRREIARRDGSAPAPKNPMLCSRVREPIAPPPPQVPTPIPRLVRDGCAWPIGEGRALRFCGAPEVLGKPYCEACCRVAYSRWSVAA